jgi:hypothetical protein
MYGRPTAHGTLHVLFAVAVVCGEKQRLGQPVRIATY